MAIEPSLGDLQQFTTDGPDGPLVMLNLLRFVADGGRERYAQYAAAAQPFLAKVGAEVVYAGDGAAALVADPGQAWDAVLLVRYPDRAAFARMVTDPGYQAIIPLRRAALAETVLQPTTPWPRPSRTPT
jgi:uncharacterized protein (DUF1330 family)